MSTLENGECAYVYDVDRIFITILDTVKEIDTNQKFYVRMDDDGTRPKRLNAGKGLIRSLCM